MTDDTEMISRIQWSVNLAANARTGPKWSIAANIDPVSGSEKPIGVSVTFDYARSDLKAVRKALVNLQKRAVAAWREHNKASQVSPVPAAPDLASMLRDAWSPG